VQKHLPKIRGIDSSFVPTILQSCKFVRLCATNSIAMLCVSFAKEIADGRTRQTPEDGRRARVLGRVDGICAHAPPAAGDCARAFACEGTENTFH
jgi:hypothetical protein